MKRLIALLLILTAILADFPAWAQRTVQVGVCQYAPLGHMDQNGEFQGLFIDILEKIAAQENWRLKYRSGSRQQALRWLATGEVEVMVSLAYSKSGSKTYNFSTPSVISTWGEVYQRPGSPVETVLDLAGCKVALLSGGNCNQGFKSLAAQFKTPVQYLTADNYQKVFELVEKGLAQAAVGERLHSKPYVQRFNLSRSPIIFSPHEIGFGFPKNGDAAIKNAINLRLGQMKGEENSFYDRAVANWVGSQTKQPAPQWVHWALAWVGGLLLVALAAAALLRRQVNQKTYEVAAKNLALVSGLKKLAHTEEALRISEEQYRTMVNNLEVGIFRSSGEPSGVLLQANPAMAGMLGYTLAELLQVLVVETYADPGSREDFLAEISSHGMVRSRDLRLKRKDGSELWARCNAVASLDDTQAVKWIDGVMMDITESKNAQQALAESEARYRRLVEQAPAGIYEIDLKHDRFLSVNDVIGGLTGYQKPELMEMKPTSLITEASRREFSRHVQSAKDNNPIHEAAELEIVTKGGDRVWVLAHINCTFKEGRPVRAQIVAHNVTVRKQTQMALMESEQRYRSLVENVPYGMFICQMPSGQFIFLNQKAYEIFGYTWEEARKLTLWQVTSQKEHILMRRRIKLRLEGGPSTGPHIYNGFHKDGHFLRFEVSVSVVQFRGQTALQGIMRDVTQREQLELQLRHAQKMEAVGTLAGGVAHEFNNILMAIRGYTQLLNRQPDLSPQVESYLEKIEASTGRAAELTNNMLGFSRLESGEMTLVAVNQVVKGVAGLLKSTLPLAIELKLDMSPQPVKVMANPNQLEQVLLNLAVNARDAMEGEGAMLFCTRQLNPSQVASSYQPPAGTRQVAEILVADTGPGIAPEHLARIFEPFFTTKDPGKGTGLGLSVAYTMIQNMGGQLEVSSSPGQGARFSIYLPVASQAAPHKEALPQKPQPLPQGSGQRILVVDDERSVREVSKEALLIHGYGVSEAAEGASALAMYQQALQEGRPYELVVLDLAMPVMDGRQCLACLLELDPKARVLVATGHASGGGELAGLDSRVAGILRKPFDLTSLVRQVARALS